MIYKLLILKCTILIIFLCFIFTPNTKYEDYFYIVKQDYIIDASNPKLEMYFICDSFNNIFLSKIPSYYLIFDNHEEQINKCGVSLIKKYNYTNKKVEFYKIEFVTNLIDEMFIEKVSLKVSYQNKVIIFQVGTILVKEEKIVNYDENIKYDNEFKMNFKCDNVKQYIANNFVNLEKDDDGFLLKGNMINRYIIKDDDNYITKICLLLIDDIYELNLSRSKDYDTND